MPAGFFIPADWEELAEQVAPLDDEASRALADRAITERVETYVEEILETADGVPLSSSTSARSVKTNTTTDRDTDEATTEAENTTRSSRRSSRSTKTVREDGPQPKPTRRRKVETKSSTSTTSRPTESRPSAGRIGLNTTATTNEWSDRHEDANDESTAGDIVFTWSRPMHILETEDVA